MKHEHNHCRHRVRHHYYVAAWLLIPENGEDQPIAAAWIAGRQNRSR